MMLPELYIGRTLYGHKVGVISSLASLMLTNNKEINMTGILARIVFAVIVGIVAFLVVLIIGELIVHLVSAAADAGSKVIGLSAILGVLFGLAEFFTGRFMYGRRNTVA